MRSLASATSLPSLPVALQHVRDLEYFDGPLLAEFRGPDNAVYLYYWCDRDEQANRWLVMSVPRHELAAYLARERPLRSLIQKEGGFLFVVDVDDALQDSGVWLIQSSDLPEEYLPSQESFYSEETPASANVVEVYVADSSILRDPSFFPRKYLDAYTFLAWFGPGQKERDLGSALRYRFTTGYVFRTAFETMRRLLPTAQQAELGAISAASPGYMSFKVDPELGQRVRKCLDSYFKHRRTIRSAYRQLQDDSGFPWEEDDLYPQRLEIATLLGVDYFCLLQTIQGEEPEADGLLRSFVNRLESIYQLHKQGHLRLIGLDWQAGVAPGRGDALL